MSTAPVFRQSDRDNLELAREIVFSRLRNDPDWHHLEYQWDAQYVSRFVQFETPNLASRFADLANEVMWQLLVQGVIVPGLNASNVQLPFFRITSYGQKVLAENRFIPHDATGYLDGLRAATGVLLTSTGMAYLEEALRCFNAGCHIASILLLGVAAESVFLELCSVIQSKLADPNERSELDPSRHVRPKHRWVVARYEGLPNAVKRGKLPESLDLTLTSLYELIRRQRNDLGHPQQSPPQLDREQAFVFFRLFPGFVADVEAFAQYCDTNGI